MKMYFKSASKYLIGYASKLVNSPGFKPWSSEGIFSIPDRFRTQVAPCHFSGPLKCFFQYSSRCVLERRELSLVVNLLYSLTKIVVFFLPSPDSPALLQTAC